MDVQYRYLFEDGRVECFDLLFDETDLSLQTVLTDKEPEPWMALSYCQCEGCSLLADETAYCPVAVNLGGLVAPFKEDFSHARVETTVTMRGREVKQTCDLQEGLRSMMGLVMATSGCPYLDRLRPMAYTHQPFATMEETFFRSVSGYFMAQLIRLREGEEPSFELDGLRALYRDINKINTAFTERLRGFGGKDAHLNALVSLDIFAQMGGMSIDERWLTRITPLFSSHLTS